MGGNPGLEASVGTEVFSSRLGPEGGVMEKSRRDFLKRCALLAACGPVWRAEVRGHQGALGQTFAPKIGITTNTRDGWANDFVRSLDEAAEVGYPAIETFPKYVQPYFDRPAVLREMLQSRGLRLETVSNGSGMEIDFVDPRRASKLLEDHMRLVRFIKLFGCDHLKINTGWNGRHTTTPEELREMAKRLDQLGKLTTQEGVKLGVHAHLWRQLELRHEVETVMQRTDPRYVNLVLDTGHYTMAGMDPVEMTRIYIDRIIEFHFKDTKPEHRGGNKGPIPWYGDRPAMLEATLRDPIFFELGKGGVDFPAITDILRRNGYQGWITVELDSTLSTPKQSARISKNYLEKTLGLQV